MGTTYSFACEDCKKVYDMDKYYRAKELVPNFLKMHQGHNTVVYSEHNDELVEKYEYSDGEYEVVEIWPEGILLEEYQNLPLKWTDEQFFKYMETKVEPIE